MKRTLTFAALAAVVLALPAWGQVIRVTAPAAGATWCIGSSYTITWTRSGAMDDTVAIRLRLRGGGDSGTRLVINRTDNDGSYGPWVVPADVTPGEYFIRINTTDGAVTDSSGAFNIAACSEPTPPSGGSIAVTSPGASSSWRPGSRQTIEWNRTGALTPMANITLRREGAPESEAPASRIADGCANNGSRVWFIPESLAEGRYFVRVKSGGVQDDSAVFSIGASGAGSGLPGPLTPIRADLSMPGVGVEYANGNIVAWVKNNGPESVRDHDVKFRLNFPERGGGEQIITRLITVPVGSEKSVELQPISRDGIPAAGLRTIVSIDTALSRIQDANLLNQHREVRIFADTRTPIDLGIRLTDSTMERVYGGGTVTHYKARSRGTMHLTRSGGGSAEIPRVSCQWELQMRRLDGTGDWHHTPETSSGAIQLGPFRNGQETTQAITVEFMIHHNWPETFEFRIAFILDPQQGINDPGRENNRTYTTAFGMD